MGKIRKGIILAGGNGTRLYPLTIAVSKQLQPVYDKPMIYYPLSTLIENGVRAICLISTPRDIPHYQRLFGNGSALGVRIEYREQVRAEGIAQALVIAESFIGADNVALVLGDNIFYGNNEIGESFEKFEDGASIFGYQVTDPERYGVIEFDDRDRPVSILEKPKNPRSNYAIPGLYLYDASAISIAKTLKPSQRGELEIADVNAEYLKQGKLTVRKMSRGSAWFDAGTSSSLHDASAFIQAIEKRQNKKVGCPEEAALRSGSITADGLNGMIASMPDCEYALYLKKVVRKTYHG